MDYQNITRRLPPTRLAFLGSLLLSFAAVYGTFLVGRDAVLYLDVARQISEEGPRVAFRVFNWPWFSLLLAGTHRLLPVPLELTAYSWCAAFLAGTCALLVAITQRFVAGSGYWACLVALSIPAFNHFRYDIIREFGFWFFCVLAFWLALRWQERGGWRSPILVHLAIVGAALFRLEAAFLLAAFALWLAAEANTASGRLKLLQFNLLPLLAAGIGGVMLVSIGGFSQSRVDLFLSLIDPRNAITQLDWMAGKFADAALGKASADDARQIVFLGLLFTLVAKFLSGCGPFLIPLLYRANWQALGDYWRKLRPLACAWLLYFGILMFFFVNMHFINGRYVSFLHVLSVPFLTMALMRFARQWPRLSKIVITLAVLVMLGNVVSLGAKRTHFLEASAWLSSHTSPADAVYYEDIRISYYAGRGVPEALISRDEALSAYSATRFRFFVLTTKAEDARLQQWMAENKKRMVQKFSNSKGDTVTIVGD